MGWEDYCDECGTQGWVYDDLSHAMGGKWWTYCPLNCKYAQELGQKEDEEFREKERRSPFKTCPTCEGSGKVRK